WTIGRHVTMSSNGTIASRSRGRFLRKTSIQTEVSTSTTSAPPPRFGASHRVEIAFPRARSAQDQDLTRADSAHEFFEGLADRSRVGLLAAQSRGFFEQLLV